MVLEILVARTQCREDEWLHVASGVHDTSNPDTMIDWKLRILASEVRSRKEIKDV